VVSEVARRADVGAWHRWRKEFGAASDGFAPVLIASPGTAAAAANGPACDEPAIEVEFAGNVRVRIPGSVPVDVPASASSSAKLLKLRVKRSAPRIAMRLWRSVRPEKFPL